MPLPKASHAKVEPWRAAVNRWGEPLFGLALLLTDQRGAAEAALINAFCHVFSGTPPADLEAALYAALINQSRQSRMRASEWTRRRRVLPRDLSRIAPRDRLLLGLWLLRDLDGARLAAISGESTTAIVARLATVIERCSPREATLLNEFKDHLTLKRWLEQQLKLSSIPADHLRVCRQCRTAATQWRETVDRLRSTLHEVVARQHLPLTCIDAIDACLLDQQALAALPWWRQRRVWLPALLAAVGVLLALQVMPRAPASPPAAAPLPAQTLVQGALDVWMAPPATGTLHLQVRAVDMRRRAGAPIITDIWQAGPNAARHRVEVHRGPELIEWQVADGAARLDYGAAPGDTSCPWNLAALNVSLPRMISLRIPPEQQQAARDARLTQGAYGIGYQALQQALTARDLRSLGVRQEGGQSLVILRYTDDRGAFPRQILLSIEPRQKQLYAVQMLSTNSSQARLRDLWRLQLRDDQAADIPTDLPGRAEPEPPGRLIDPACPILNAEHLLSLRALVQTPWRPWYLPQSLPPGITHAAAISPIPLNRTELEWGARSGSSAVFVGPGRWLRLTPATWRPNASSPRDQVRGEWRVELDSAIGFGTRHGTLRLTPDQAYSGWVPTIDLDARGWSEDELLALVDTLALADTRTWINLNAHFLDPQPLSPATRTTLEQVFAALQPQPDQTLYSVSEITTRPYPPHPTFNDPYTIADGLLHPTTLHREQWLTYSGGQLTRFYDLHTRLDHTLYKALIDDGTNYTFDYRADGWVGTDSSAQITADTAPQQIGLEMLEGLIKGTGSITLTAEADSWRLEEAMPHRANSVGYEFFSRELPIPWTDDLLEGDVIRRLWLDRTTYLPQRFELLHRDAQGHETLLHRTLLNERRVVDAPPSPDRVALPPLPDDTLMFNSTASRWRRARVAIPSLPRDVSTSNFDTLNEPMLVDQTLERSADAPILTWPPDSGAIVNWQLAPAASLRQLSIGMVRSSTWDNLARLAVVDRTQYRMPPNDVMLLVSQGPRKLLRNILRYQQSVPYRSGPAWNRSERIPVMIAGEQHDAWLLRSNDVSVLVIEIRDLMVHIVGPAEYLKGPLIAELAKLQWTAPEH